MSVEGMHMSKAFLISGALVAGTGLVYIIYQQYVLEKTKRYLTAQIVELNQRILKLENELKHIKEIVAASSSTDEIDEIFVDASDVAHQGITEKFAANIISDRGYQDKFDEKLLANLDHQLEEGGYKNLSDVYSSLAEVVKKNPKNAEVYWRLAKASFLLASEDMLNHPNCPHDGQRDLMQKAHEAAATALKINNESGYAHKWMAIITGSVTQFLPVQEQIKNAYIIKEHIQAGIEHMPEDSLLHHMLGRWCYSVYMLTWVERKVASTLFAVPPTATLEEAMECFLKAEELSPKSSIDNALYLGKGYIAQKDYTNAMYWLKVGEKMQASSRDDIKSLNDIRELLSQYEAYA